MHEIHIEIIIDQNLVDEHEDDGGVTPSVSREEGEGVGVIQKLVAESPIHGRGRR